MALTDIFAGLGALLARNPDGSNNDGDSNSSNDIGETGDAYLRITPNSYADGLGAMRFPVAPTNPPPIPIPQPPALVVGDLPQARAISDAVMALGPTQQNIPSSFGVNELFDFFGQLLTHDVAEAATASTGELPLLMDGLPFPFARTPFETDTDGVRQQHNEETSFLDLSMVYGNSQATQDLARADLPGHTGQSAKLLLGADGLLPTIKEVGIDAGLTSLQVLAIMRPDGFGGLPDPATNPPDATFENLFYAGDNRVNQQAPLITLQTIWAREHNYQVDQLTPYATAHGWTQDQLFEAARAITEAEWQAVVYGEYVPTLIGTHADELLAAYQVTHPGDIAAGIINEWTTVAFRFGHDQSSNDYKLLNADGTTYLNTSLSNAFALAAAAQNVPGAGHSAADLDAWIRGLSAQFAQEIDGKIADGNRNALFGIGVTADLEAFDIQRGRDHGVWNYNELRAGLGLSTYASFAAFGTANNIDATRLQALSDVYGGDINKLDSIVGGMLEKHYKDSQLGETFTLLNAIQFAALQQGDQFYYENRLANNPELLADIKGITLAEIADRNSGTDHLHLDSFQVANRMAFSDGRDSKNGADLAAYLKADLMIGKGGNDLLFGRDGNDTLYGDGGNDRLDGGKGDDFLKCGSGNDAAYGGAGNDKAWGEDGHDILYLGAGDDWADGGNGNDRIFCEGGNDTALGKAGNDSLYGGGGHDRLFGGDGNDYVSGGDGNDRCYGGAGNDLIFGGAGNDLICGEGGNDSLYGGTGYDTFTFGTGSGKDRIYDFNVNQDVIDLSDLGLFDTFASLTITSNRTTTIIDLGDTDGDGAHDTIELVGVSQRLLKEANFVFHHDDAVV